MLDKLKAIEEKYIGLENRLQQPEVYSDPSLYAKLAKEQKEITPSWGYQEAEAEVTLSPSVLSSSFSCRSHYFIRRNRIQWC